MALEEMLARLTAALDRNSDLLEGLTAKAKAGVEKAKQEEPKAPASTKEDDEEAPKPRRRSMEDEDEPTPAKRTRTTKAEPKRKAPTDKELSDKLAKFGEDAPDDDDYDARRAAVKKFLTGKGVTKAAELPPEDRIELVDMLDAYGKD